MSKTGEEVGYEDAMRQVQRSMQRRLKSLQEAHAKTDDEKQRMIQARIEEVEHLLQVIESLHR